MEVGSIFMESNIETLDNPGWAVEIDLCETELINHS